MVTLSTGLFKRQRGHGTLYVTDARVVFYAQVYPRGTQKASWIFQQTNLKDISGLAANVSRRLSLGLVVLTLAFALLTIGTLLTIVLIPLAIVFRHRDRASDHRVGPGLYPPRRRGGRRSTRGRPENSPIAFGHLPQQRGFLDALGRLLIFPIAIFLRSYSAFDVVAGDPGNDAPELLHELGALGIDLQTRGTIAYPEWKHPSSR